MKIKQPFDLIEFLHDFLMTDDEEAIAAFASYCRIVTKEKGDIIFRPGITEDSTTILLDGVIKTFILSPDGTENTFAIYYQPGTAVCATKEMINIPEIWCTALTRCTLIEMVGTSPYQLAEEYPVLWKELMYGTMPFAIRIMNKVRVGYTLTAKERYLWFLDNYGPVVDRISQEEIAMYLGIKPQSLSRIRSELAGERIIHTS